MRRTLFHPCLVVLVTFLASGNGGQQNTITSYDNKTSLERTTLKEQEQIHADVLRHITTTTTTTEASLKISSTPLNVDKPNVDVTISNLLTTPRSITEEEQLQKIQEDKDKNNNPIQIYENYERKLTINENGPTEIKTHSPDITNKTSSNEVIDVVTYKYNESGPSTSSSSRYVTVSQTSSSYEQSSSVIYTEEDEDDHTPEYHSVTKTPDNDDDDDGHSDNVNDDEESKILTGLVPVIDLNTSISDKKDIINNDVTLNNKLRPDALDERESTTNISIRNNSSKDISLENINSTVSSGDSVNQSVNSIINNNNVNIDENTTKKPIIRYSVRKSQDNTLSVSNNNTDNLVFQSTTNTDLLKLDTRNVVPEETGWERIPEIVQNKTIVNNSVLNDTENTVILQTVTVSPSVSTVVKPNIAFKNKLLLYPIIRTKTTSPPSDFTTESSVNSSENLSEEEANTPLHIKHNLNITIKTAISTRKRPPKYYYLSQNDSLDLTIPPTATAWALASMISDNSRVVKKSSSPGFATTEGILKNDTLSVKPTTTPAPGVKPFIPWSTRLQRITTETTMNGDISNSSDIDSLGSSTSNAINIQETTEFTLLPLNTSVENTTRPISTTNNIISTTVELINNINNNTVETVTNNNITKTEDMLNDQSSTQPYYSPSTEESNETSTVISAKVITNRTETVNNSSKIEDMFNDQSSTLSYYSLSTEDNDKLSSDVRLTTAQYVSSESTTAVEEKITLPSSSPSSVLNDTKTNIIERYDFNNETEIKNSTLSKNDNKTENHLVFDMNQTSNEIKLNETIKFKSPSSSDVIKDEFKNNTVNEPEAITEDTVFDSGLQPSDDNEEDAKPKETTIVPNFDLPLEMTTNADIAIEEEVDNEDEDLPIIDKPITKTPTTETINQDANIPDFDSSEDIADDKKTNKEIVETNEDKNINKNLTGTTEKLNKIDINWYNVSVQTIEETNKNSNTTEVQEPTTEKADHSETTPPIIVTTSSTEAPTTTITTTSTTEIPTTTATTIPTRFDDPLHSVDDLPAYISLHVETSLAKICKDRQKLKQAIVSLFKSKSERTISESQVILLNVGKQQCTNVTKSEDTLIPVNILMVDEGGQYDAELMDECLQLFKDVEHNGFDSYFTVHTVGLVMQRMAPPVAGKGSVIAAITLSFIAAICLLLLGILLVVIRRRQKGFNYGQRCTPVSLDDYSLDNISVYNSVRRKGALRASKRSYGNPAFDDPGAPSHEINFAGLANFSGDREALHEEFSQIPMITVKSDELPPGAETKNRYANVIPLPETRVQLTGKEGCDHLDEYINANFVKGPKGVEKFYIACQAPMQSTVNDFWRMIWQQQCKVILMLTDLQENGVEKCADYMPPCEVLDCHRLFGDFQVTLKKREEREKYVISSLQLKNLETSSWREVTHLWYASWPTHGVPEDCSAIIAFLIEARSFMRGTTGPTVVHCSPGTGRTGTVIAIDICIRDFETTRSVDIPKTVYAIRRDRAGAVQTKDQYTFIYQVLNLYAAKLTGGALDSF